eukprot:m.156709 g.156709  ORF g.156709 m.156709 type:complete len:671 (+) comp23635_c1_seq2:246-2258(+)
MASSASAPPTVMEERGASEGKSEQHASATESEMAVEGDRRYLLVCPGTFEGFRLPELESVAAMVGATFRLDGPITEGAPYVSIRASAKDARALVQRSVCVRFGIEVWGEGASWDECHDAIRRLPPAVTAPILEATTPFKCAFESIGKKKIPKEQRAALMRSVEYLNLKGPVTMKGADRTLYFVEEYRAATDLAPIQTFFGPLVAVSSREEITPYSLKTRKLIGNTSMDPELSFIMANMGHAAKGSIVLDPFVGTGSLLYAAAHFGAMVVGTDINKSVLHGLGKTSRAKAEDKQRRPDENIAATMVQYGLADRFLGLWLVDQSNNTWRDGQTPLFDSIITDPPYGIREGARKVSTKSGGDGADGSGSGYWSRTESEGYTADSVYGDLLNFAARVLRPGGRLVYWLPVIQADYNEAQVPRHPCLDLVANTEQSLSGKLARRLITMVKRAEWDPSVGSSSSEAPALNNDFRAKIFAKRERALPAAGPSARRLVDLPGLSMSPGVSAEGWDAVSRWIAGGDGAGPLREVRVGVRTARFGLWRREGKDDSTLSSSTSADIPAVLLRVLGVEGREDLRCVVTEYHASQGVGYTPELDGITGVEEVIMHVFGDRRTLRFRSSAPVASAEDADVEELQRYQVDVEHGARLVLRPPLLGPKWEHSIASGGAPFVVISIG